MWLGSVKPADGIFTWMLQLSSSLFCLCSGTPLTIQDSVMCWGFFWAPPLLGCIARGGWRWFRPGGCGSAQRSQAHLTEQFVLVGLEHSLWLALERNRTYLFFKCQLEVELNLLLCLSQHSGSITEVLARESLTQTLLRRITCDS